MDSGDYIVTQLMSFPFHGIGHVVVIVGYDPVRGFKIKSSDEESGEVIWIPFERMTWFQCFATEEDLKGVRFSPPTWDSATYKLTAYDFNISAYTR